MTQSRSQPRSSTRRSQPRQKPGTPAGGQFAPRRRPEPDVELGALHEPSPFKVSEVGLFSFHRNPDGSPGGLVALSATVDPTATVGADAIVADHAEVRDTSAVLDHARVIDNAIVTGGSVVRDGAVVGGSAVIEDGSTVSGSAVVDREALITAQSLVTGAVHVTNDALVGKKEIDEGVIDDTATSSPVTSNGPHDIPAAWLEEDIGRPYAGRFGRAAPLGAPAS